MFTILFQSCSKRKRSAGARQLTGPDDKVFSTSKMIHILPGVNSATTNLGIFTNSLHFHIHLHCFALGKFWYYTQKIKTFDYITFQKICKRSIFVSDKTAYIQFSNMQIEIYGLVTIQYHTKCTNRIGLKFTGKELTFIIFAATFTWSLLMF